MRIHRLLPLALVALAGLSLGAGCPTVPSLKDRVVELAVGGSTTLTIPAAGVINTYTEDVTVDLASGIDLNTMLSDAGIDVSELKDVKVSGISYRVTVPDPNPGRTIAGATVSAQRGVAAPQPLITSFTQKVDAVTEWTQAPVDPAGITLVNGVLTDILNNKKYGTPFPTPPTVTFHIQGTSQPTGQTTNFTWQIRLDLSIVGTKKLTVLS